MGFDGFPTLGVLKRTCTQLTDMKARRTLYLTHVKSQLRYATEVWSPVNNTQLSKQVERVRRRATRWIMMSGRGELSYKERLLALDLLPLTFDKGLRTCVVFLYKALFGYVNVVVSNCASFVSQGRTRLSITPQRTFYKVKFVEQALFNLRTIIVSSNCGTLYVKMYVWTLCLVQVFS